MTTTIYDSVRTELLHFSSKPGVTIALLLNRAKKIGQFYPVDADAHYADRLASMVDEEHVECPVLLAGGIRYAGFTIGESHVLVFGCPMGDPKLKSLPRSARKLAGRIDGILKAKESST